ncbi:hypothetical protein V1514DRAFT_327281 [Lipomyces japonicus]|uniref:uncharacterized protein n=1 Tax=Lipomyces japonicus TaxID=56871 RepID=UPI0034CD4FB5
MGYLLSFITAARRVHLAPAILVLIIILLVAKPYYSSPALGNESIARHQQGATDIVQQTVTICPTQTAASQIATPTTSSTPGSKAGTARNLKPLNKNKPHDFYPLDSEQDDSSYYDDEQFTCLNPYQQPGFLWYPVANSGEERNTAWIPYYDGLLDEPYSLLQDKTGIPADPILKNFDRDFPDGPPDEELRQTAPANWMQQLQRHDALHKRSDKVSKPKSPALKPEEIKELEALEEKLFWLRNSRVLLLSDSVDRYESGFVCFRFGGWLTISKHGYQTTADCTLKYWNATFMNWHLASLSTIRPEWWWMKDMKVVPFEQRWDAYYKETIKDIVGMNGIGPDLIIVNSALWDLSYFATGRKARGKTKELEFGRPLNWRELRFYMQRLRAVLNRMRTEFGDNVPMLFRGVTSRNDDPMRAGALNLDLASRFVCRDFGIEIMEFGRLIQGYTNFYKDDVHFALGPASVLWSNMVFWHLFRARGGIEVKGEILKLPSKTDEYVTPQDAWKKCHSKFIMGTYL